MGYSVFRQVDKDGNAVTYDSHGNFVLPPEQWFEQGCHYSWPASGKRLKAEVLVTDDAQELLLFLAAHSDLKRADDPGQKLMGFARHDVQAGTSLTYRMRTDDIQALEDRPRAAILSRHAAVHDAQTSRMKRAVALARTLRAQGRADVRPE